MDRSVDGVTAGNVYLLTLFAPADKIYRGDADKNDKGFQNITSLDVGLIQNWGLTLTWFGKVDRPLYNGRNTYGLTDDTMQYSLRYRLAGEKKAAPSVFVAYAQRDNGGSYTYAMATKKWKKLLGRDTTFYIGATRELNNVDNPASTGDPSPKALSTYVWGGILRPLDKNHTLFIEFDGMATNLAVRRRSKGAEVEIKAYDLAAPKIGFGVGYSFNCPASHASAGKAPARVPPAAAGPTEPRRRPEPPARPSGRGGEAEELVRERSDRPRVIGAAVEEIEEKLPVLNARVAARERLRLDAVFESKFVSQGFSNRGVGTWNDRVGRLPALDPGSAFGVDLYMLRGAAAGVNWNRLTWPGMLDYVRGRPLMSGTGLTSRAAITLGIDVSATLDADAQLNAYVSQGEPLVDAIWGTPASWLSNVHMSGRVSANPQSQVNAPWTRFTFDSLALKFYDRDKSSGVSPSCRVTLGAFDDPGFDRHIYAGLLNPAVYGPSHYGGFGLDASGSARFLADMRWELLWTRIPDGAMKVGGASPDYFPSALGAAFRWTGESGAFRLNFLRASSGDFSGAAAVPGGIDGVNSIWLRWVNPSGFLAADLPDPAQRPIVAGDGDMGGFGPQAVTMWGASWSAKLSPHLSFDVDYGRSRYWPNMQSSYTREGGALRAALGYAPPGWRIDLDYICVEPTYDPMINQFPANNILFRQVPDTGGLPYRHDGIGGFYQRFPDLNYFPIGYALHDTRLFPHNRQGFRLKVSRALAKGGTVWAELGALEQQRSSVPDVRLSGIAYGLAPGFIDPVFFLVDGLDDNNNPYEDRKGRSTNWGLGGSFTLAGSGLSVSCSIREWRFRRESSISAYPADYRMALSSKNNVDFGVSVGSIGLAYPVTVDDKRAPVFTLRGGYEWGAIAGHYEPSGAFNAYALEHGGNGFTTVDTQQTSPWVGFDCKVGKDATWSMDFKFINTVDLVHPDFPTPNIYYHPFTWRGMQVSSEIKFKM